MKYPQEMIDEIISKMIELTTLMGGVLCMLLLIIALLITIVGIFYLLFHPSILIKIFYG